MTPREFFNAWQGYSEAESERMEAIQAITFGASRYNAANTAFSSDQSKAISKQKFPWEEGGSKKKNEPLKWEKMKGFFNAISTEENGRK